jgi:tRNA 2-selenouridine synthase
VIDARSEGEYAEDHLPGAVNWPSLHDEERQIVGTKYKQISQFEAKKLGAALVAKNIAEHIQRDVLDKPKGMAAAAVLLARRQAQRRAGAGAGPDRLQDHAGGRRLQGLPGRAGGRPAATGARFQLPVVCGPTGSGKTRLLQALAAEGAQVLDLEALANHRSSVLGAIPGVQQPSQKRF